MTKVFVWKNYGEVSVYAFETAEQQNKLVDEVYDEARYIAGDSNDVDSIDFIKNQKISAKAKIRRMLDFIEIGNHETFEHGTGFVEVQE